MFSFAPANEADFDRLFQLRLATMRESLERIGRFDATRAFERFRSHYHPEHTRLIMVPDGTMVGCVALSPDGKGGLELEHFYIAPGYQGSGLGSAVLRQLLAEAAQQQLPVRLCVLRQSDAARFYERHGFQQTGEGPWDIFYEWQPAMDAD